MTETVRQIVTRAARKIGAANEGQPSPAPYDADVLKQALLDWYLTAIDAGTFGALKPVSVSADYTAKENERIANISGGDITITLPVTVTDRWTCKPRAPRDGAVVQVSGDTTWLYDSALGDWVDLGALTLESAAPLSGRSADGLASVVAVLVMEERGLEAGAQTVARAARFRMALAADHGVRREPVRHDFF